MLHIKLATHSAARLNSALPIPHELAWGCPLSRAVADTNSPHAGTGAGGCFRRLFRCQSFPELRPQQRSAAGWMCMGLTCFSGAPRPRCLGSGGKAPRIVFTGSNPSIKMHFQSSDLHLSTKSKCYKNCKCKCKWNVHCYLHVRYRTFE